MKPIKIGKKIRVLRSHYADLGPGDVGTIVQHLVKHYGYGVEFTKEFAKTSSTKKLETRVIFCKHTDVEVFNE